MIRERNATKILTRPLFLQKAVFLFVFFACR